MKKLLSLATILTISSCAVAGFNDTNKAGGFNGGAAPKSATVAQALKAGRDDMPVQLTGKIISQVDDEEYIFQDATGQIKVEIDRKVWRGVDVSPNDIITIYGKVDKETFKPNEVEVYRLQKH